MRRQMALPSPAVEGRPPQPLFLRSGAMPRGAPPGSPAGRCRFRVGAEPLDPDEQYTAAVLLDGARRLAASLQVAGSPGAEAGCVTH